ncbi:MAG: NAD(P)-dependent oxidoreductase [Deltaproteobacteria bacterium]|nr:NAD(P)-dependent oxidoreductase [Deltaproteobacteria bacterium]
MTNGNKRHHKMDGREKRSKKKDVPNSAVSPQDDDSRATHGRGRFHRVLVTGAGGCVGSLVVQQLIGLGHDVRATDRPGARQPDLAGALEGPRSESTELGSMEWVEGDLTDHAVAASLVRGVDAIIHTAAWVDIAVSFEQQAPINLYAVQDLYEVAREAGVRHFIHFSTGSLYAPKNGPIREGDPLRATSAYEETKMLAEDYLDAEPGPTVNMLRPALIYGPRGKVLVAPVATVPELLSALDGLVPGIEGGPKNNLVHSLDVARAAVHLLEHPQPDGSRFNVACDDLRTIGEYMAIVMRQGRVRLAPLRLPFPGSIVRAALPLLTYERPVRLLNRTVSAIWNRTIRHHHLTGDLIPRVDREAVPYLAGDTIFDNSAIKATGFEFRYPNFEEGWADTVRWYREQKWLPETPPSRRRLLSAVRSGSSSHRSETADAIEPFPNGSRAAAIGSNNQETDHGTAL